MSFLFLCMTGSDNYLVFHCEATELMSYGGSKSPWIGHVNVQSCLLINFQYKPISLQYSWLSVEQPIRIDWELYKHHWEFPINKKIIPMLICPISPLLADNKVCHISLLQFIYNSNLTKIITVPMLPIIDFIQAIFYCACCCDLGYTNTKYYISQNLASGV